LNPPTTRELSLISHISSFDFLFTHLAIQGWMCSIETGQVLQKQFYP
jgi:hypothetical protein